MKTKTRITKKMIMQLAKEFYHGNDYLQKKLFKCKDGFWRLDCGCQERDAFDSFLKKKGYDDIFCEDYPDFSKI